MPRQSEAGSLIVVCRIGSKGFEATRDFRLDEVVRLGVTAFLPPLERPGTVVCRLKTRMGSRLPKADSKRATDIVLLNYPVYGVLETHLPGCCTQGSRSDQQMVRALAAERSNVLEQKMPSQLVEVAFIGGDVGIGLTFLKGDRVNLDLGNVKFGKHSVSNRPRVIHCVECVNVVAFHCEFMAKVK